MPIYTFMTGFQKYRIEAKDLDEALHVAFDSLKPDANMKAIIQATICDEAAAKQFQAEVGTSESSEDEDD